MQCNAIGDKPTLSISSSFCFFSFAAIIYDAGTSSTATTSPSIYLYR